MVQMIQRLFGRNNRAKTLPLLSSVILMIFAIVLIVLTTRKQSTSVSVQAISSPATSTTTALHPTSTIERMSTVTGVQPTATLEGSTPVATVTTTPLPATATPVLATATPVHTYHYKMIQVVNSGLTPAGFTNQSVNLTVTCPSGTYLMSGGYQLTDPAGTSGEYNLANVPDVYPLSTTSWYFTSSYTDPKSAPFYAYANCLQTDYPIRTLIVSGPATLQGNGDYSVPCPTGMIVTGGGWRYNRHMNSWQVIGNKWDANGAELVYAICANFDTGGINTENTASIVSNTVKLSSSVSVACPTGQLLVGGGFISNGPPSVLDVNTSLATTDFSSWVLGVTNIDSVHTYPATVQAICIAV